jgi:hypothetical protein
MIFFDAVVAMMSLSLLLSSHQFASANDNDDPEWALVLLLASRLISTLSSLLIFLDSLHAIRNRIH